MILKGSARKGALDLALHLSNSVDNETVTFAEINGAVASDIYSAFHEWELIGMHSRADKPFYSLSVNPDPQQRDLTTTEWRQAVDHVERELGFAGQPRAIVFHEKQGEDGNVRKHAHVVWSRIKTDTEKLRAIAVSHDYYKLKRCAQELSKRFGLELRYQRGKGDAFDHALSHGRNRDPETAAARRERITKLWQTHPDPTAFMTALTEHGYVPARGNRRAFVIVDQDSEVHSLARQITGTRVKDIKARLGNADGLPSVEDAKTQQKNTTHNKRINDARQDLSREQRRMQKLRRMAMRADTLRQRRNKDLIARQEQIKKDHQNDKQHFIRHRGFTEAKRLRRRADKRPKGRVKIICDTIGVTKILTWLDAREDQKYDRHYKKRYAHLNARHRAEQARLKSHSRHLRQQDQREAKSMQRLAHKLNLNQTQLESIQQSQKQNAKMTKLSPRLA